MVEQVVEQVVEEEAEEAAEEVKALGGIASQYARIGWMLRGAPLHRDIEKENGVALEVGG